ncbi:hypothetical protein MRB53_034563 [Persea americana]|uniref:Uncharacterized protein n=1 Tax=Persea americana TaxID=3435 RepID=A0ACC2K248_PERAE|nr:hypothetical protein MRB53_034563 [Persea americana]
MAEVIANIREMESIRYHWVATFWIASRKLVPYLLLGPRTPKLWRNGSSNKTFLAMNCPEDQNLPLTAFILQGEAEHWYGALVTGYQTARQVPTWAEFEREFDDKFIPKHVRDWKKQEFQILQQGSMTMAQYDMK